MPQLPNKLLAIWCSYQIWFTDQQTSCNWEFLSEPIDATVTQQTPCNLELLSDLIDSLMNPQMHFDQELLSELVASLIKQ